MLTIIHGKDSLRSRIALRQLLALRGEMSLQRFDGNEARADEVRMHTESASLFGHTQMLVVEDGLTTTFGSELAEAAWLSSLAVASHVHLVLYEGADMSVRIPFKKIAAHAQVMKLDPLSGVDAAAWLAQQTKTPRAIASAVYARCGKDMWSSYNELSKLKTFCADAAATQQDISTLGIGTTQANAFAAIDALLAANAEEGFARMQQLWLAGESPMGFFGLLERQVKVLALVAEALDEGRQAPAEIAKRAGIPPFAVGKSISASKRLGWLKIRELYARVESLDEKVKRGLIDPYFACELFASAVVA